MPALYPPQECLALERLTFPGNGAGWATVAFWRKGDTLLHGTNVRMVAGS